VDGWTGAIVVDDESWNTFVGTLDGWFGRLDVGSMVLVADFEGGTVVGEGGLLGEDLAGCFLK
jgi:hypothetical protein